MTVRLDESETIPEYMGWLRMEGVGADVQQFANLFWAHLMGDMTLAEFRSRRDWDAMVSSTVQDCIETDLRALNKGYSSPEELYRHRVRQEQITAKRHATMSGRAFRPPRDSQRSKVYAAEEFLRSEGRRFSSLDEIQQYVDKLVGSAWWGRRSNVRSIKVHPQRSNASAMAHPSRRTIHMPEWAWCESIVLHEVAHVWTERAAAPEAIPSHGREFARNLLELVGRQMGADCRRRLKASFVEHKVKHSLPRRPMTEEQRQAAAERLGQARIAAKAMA